MQFRFRRSGYLPDWDHYFRILMFGKPRLRLHEIMKLTEVEVAFMLDQDIENPRPPLGGRKMTPPELEAYGAWRRSLSWLDKLKMAVSNW